MTSKDANKITRGHKGGALIQKNQCPYKKSHQRFCSLSLSPCARVRQMPGDSTAGRCSSKKPGRELASASWPSSLQKGEKIIFCSLSHRSVAFCSSSPSRLAYGFFLRKSQQPAQHTELSMEYPNDSGHLHSHLRDLQGPYAAQVTIPAPQPNRKWLSKTYIYLS